MAIEPSVSLPGEVVRRVTPAKVACRLGCGGPSGCRHEQQNFTKNGFSSIFNSISANWVLIDELIAMARPSEPFLETLLPEMRQAGVKSFVNVQELGEHGHCGFILKSGFTYLPESIMKAGISFYNFPTADFGIWENRMLLQIAKVLEGAANDGAIAIHCHAGLGRTGVICAAHLTFSRGLTSQEATKIVRENRPGSLQTRGQIAACDEFETYVLSARHWPTESDTLQSLYASQRPTTVKRTQPRKMADICVPHFVDYFHTLVQSNDFNQPNTFNLEEWLIPVRVKKGMWPQMRLMSKKQLADIMVEWCFALKDPIIGGAGSTDYVEVLTSLSSIVTGRLIADSLLDLGLGLPDVVDALTHRQTGVDAAKLVKFLRENDPTS